MRPKAKRVTKRSVALWAAVLVLFVLFLLMVSSITGVSEAPDDGVRRNTLAPPAQPPKADKVPLSTLLEKVRLFMLIHNVSMNESLPPPVADTAASAETARYLEKCVNNMDANPESVLLYHFNASDQGEMASLNAEAERELLDDGYAQFVSRSKEFWDPMHSLRRGYGTEGSIFIALPFAATAGDVYKIAPLTQQHSAQKEFVHAGCANTVRSVFSSAKWPIGISVATPQLMFTKLVDNGENRTVDRVIHCLPPEFSAPSEEQSYGFAFKDNVRTRSVVIPLPANRVHTEADAVQQSTRFSASHAMRFALMQLYQGESYVMFSNPGVVFAPGWDWTAKLLLLHLPERGRAVLSNPATNVAKALAESYLSVLSSTAVQNAGIPVNVGVASPGLMRLKEAVDHDPSTVARMVTPLWLHPHLSATHVAGDGVSALPSSAVPPEMASVRAFFGLSGGAAEQNDSSLELRLPSLTPSLVMDIIERRHDVTFMLPEVCANSETTWLVNDREIHKARLECAWLLQHRAQLQQVFARKLEEWPATNVAVASAVRTGGTTGEDLLVEVSAAPQGRQSHALREPRYLRPGQPASTLPLSSEMWSLSHVHQGSTGHSFPYLAELVGSTDFVFTRAEAFMEYHTEDVLQFDPTHAEPPGASLRLDPFLALLSTDEESFYLSAKLWTNGWNLFAPTENIAFTVQSSTNSSRAGEPSVDGPSKSERLPKPMHELRERTAKRWQHFFTCRRDLSETCVDGLGGAAYAPGTERNIIDFLKWTGVTVA